MKHFDHFLRNQRRYEITFFATLLTSNAILIATSEIMEAHRHGQAISFELWEPFVWQFSSALLIALLLPLVIKFIDSPFSSWLTIKRTLAIYFTASIVFSLLHVTGMVVIRKLIYISQGLNYDFGSLPYEFFYEYRKDLFTFISIIALVHSYRFIHLRLQGEADMIGEGEDSAIGEVSDRLLVKKLGKEFIVKLSDVEWLESSGNYVNLHIGTRIYPTRQTLSNLIASIAAQGFCRTHRSYAVNLDEIESITPLHSGSSDITLKSGKVISLSRRYHKQLKQRLS